MKVRSWTTQLAVIGAALITGCAAEPSVPTAQPGHEAHTAATQVISVELERALATLKRLTRPYRSLPAAMAAGYNAQLTGCMELPPAGGMGFHYGDVRLIDAVVDPLRPEILMYEPQANGDLLFVGVEYVVPYSVWAHQEPPHLLGVPFHRNDTFQLWVLHAWIWKSNPAGMLADWNPRVTCKFAKPTT